jgi:hypothetical protein
VVLLLDRYSSDLRIASRPTRLAVDRCARSALAATEAHRWTHSTSKLCSSGFIDKQTKQIAIGFQPMSNPPKILQTLSLREEDAVKTTHVDFAIRSDALDPAALTAELGITPSRAWAMNEEYVGRAFDPDSRKTISVVRKRPWGLWAISSDEALTSKLVEQHALHLLNLLEPRKGLLTHYLREDSGYTLRFFIWWEPLDGHGSYQISSKTLRRLSEVVHYVEFECICLEESEKDMSSVGRNL